MSCIRGSIGMLLRTRTGSQQDAANWLVRDREAGNPSSAIILYQCMNMFTKSSATLTAGDFCPKGESHSPVASASCMGAGRNAR